MTSTLARTGAVAALAVSAFSYVTTENLPVGLLPLIAEDLGTSRSAVGLLVTGYGATVALVSVPLTRLTRRVPRRALFTVLLATFVVATLVSAAAPGYGVLLGARVVTALSQAIFWAVVAPVAAGLYRPERRGRAIALVFGGASLASVLGVPAGTWLGQQAGWRVAFLALSGLGLLTLVAVVLLLPAGRRGVGLNATGTSPDVRRYRIVLATTVLSITGLFATYTYIVVFLTEVSGFSAAQVVPVLLVQGVAGVAGVVCAGAAVDRAPWAVLATAVGLLSAALLGLAVAGHLPYAAAALVALSGFALAGVPNGAQNLLMRVAPGSTEIASAWNSTAFNVGIAGGALIGGFLLPVSGVRGTALVGAVLTTTALVVVLSERLIPRQPIRPWPTVTPEEITHEVATQPNAVK